MEYNWVFKTTDPKKVQQLSQQLNISSLVSNLLVNLNLTRTDDLKQFLEPSISNLYDPFLMKGMEAAVDRLGQAVRRKEKIMIFGDYDVDGTTASALLYLFLSEIGLNPIFYIPNREKEGYGVSIIGIDYALSSDVTLIVTCDCGINAFSEIDYATQKGIDVIVTDHHEPGENLPECFTVIDPKRSDDNYPFKELCGAGVAFKLLQGLSIRNNIDIDRLIRHLDLVAIGTAADIVPILDENRILVSKGLKVLNNPAKIGIRSLIRISGFENRQISVVNIVFGIAPRLNAAGRLGDASRAVKLLSTTDYREATELSHLLDEENKNRQSIEKATIDSAIAKLNAKYDLSKVKTLILSDENWHLGVIGIVASKLKEIYNRPVIMISFQNNIGKGSARSIHGFDLYDALNRCADYLTEFGGHKMAAGLSIEKDALAEFEDCFQKITSDSISDEMLLPSLNITSEITLSDINQETIEFLRKMAPFGPGNMRPLFMSKNLRISGLPRIVGENHLKFKVKQGKLVLGCIGWRLGELYEMLISNRPLDMVFVIEENIWKGVKEIQLNIKDIKYSEVNLD